MQEGTMLMMQGAAAGPMATIRALDVAGLGLCVEVHGNFPILEIAPGDLGMLTELDDDGACRIFQRMTAIDLRHIRPNCHGGGCGKGPCFAGRDGRGREIAIRALH